MEYRNELKFELSDCDLARIKNRLLPLMHTDMHQGKDGYIIRSLYFDDLYNTCAAEKENGVLRREKYRIRQYDNNPNYIRLEKKTRHGDMSQKTMQPISLPDYDALLSGNADRLCAILTRNEDGLLGELIFKILYRKFAPRCIVAYERFAFTERTGNVRVTFDRNIAGSRQINSLFAPDLFTVPLMPSNRHILEVKYDELLPHYILQALDTGRLRRQSFSKYYMTRAAIG